MQEPCQPQAARRNAGIIFTQTNAFCAASNFVLAGLVLREVSAWKFSGICYIIAALANTLWWWLTRKGIVPRIHKQPVQRLGSAARRWQAAWLVLAHSLSSSAGFLCLWLALERIEAHVGAILSRSEAVVGILLGIIWLKERLTRTQFYGLLLAAGGVLTLRWTVLSGEPIGFYLMIASAVTFGLSEVLGKVCVRLIPVPRLAFMRGWIMAMVLCLAWLMIDPGWPSLSTPMWGWLALSAIIGPVLSRNSYLLALSYLPISQVMVYNQTQPLYAALLAIFILGEVPQMRTYIGGAILIAGVIIVMRGRRE